MLTPLCIRRKIQEIMTFGVIVFPGSNCDHDSYHVAKHVFGQEARFIWHKEETLDEDIDVVLVPGGFSYGDYLRAGAIARFSPIMQSVQKFAQNGGLVLGICNGFQVLCESGLLPGALMRNDSLRFACKNVYLRVENTDTPFTRALKPGQVLQIPVANGEGNFFADEQTVETLETNGRVVFRYCDADGNITPDANPNGSVNNIAGIVNPESNVLAMMPHPERCAEPIISGRADGALIFESLLQGSEVQAA